MCYYYTIRARFPHVPNENCLTTAELQRTLTCTESERERERGGSNTDDHPNQKSCQRAMCTDKSHRPSMSLHYFAFHSTKRRSENVTGEEGRNILDNFSVWLLSRFAGHSCFPARRPFAISSPCALRREHNDHRARERTTQSLLTAK